jgi:hypothetical protein
VSFLQSFFVDRLSQEVGGAFVGVHPPLFLPFHIHDESDLHLLAFLPAQGGAFGASLVEREKQVFTRGFHWQPPFSVSAKQDLRFLASVQAESLNIRQDMKRHIFKIDENRKNFCFI